LSSVPVLIVSSTPPWPYVVFVHPNLSFWIVLLSQPPTCVSNTNTEITLLSF
jgi:hypothetical protein